METGVEQWAFVPQEFLSHQADLYQNDPSSGKHYGIDGNIRVYMKADGDNVIEAGEKVYLFFGMRRGGDFYYGLDVTNPAQPTLLWRIGTAQLPGLGQSWSTPVPTRIRVGTGSGQNPDQLVLVIGGGYEPDQDNAAASTDTIGNSIYIVDMVSGALLWHGGLAGTHKSFNYSGKSMSYSIPGDIRVIDTNNNGFADRMYAADMGGQVWRFDITNGNTATSLVTGGVIAQLGAAPSASPTLANTRRFFYAPDIAFVNTRTENFTHVGIGSGHRERPLSTTTQDRYYALRDYGFAHKTQAQFDALVPATNASLTLVDQVNEPIAAGSRGWYFNLSGSGEKVLSEARTIANEVFFSTYRPGSTVSACVPQAGTNRHYRMSIFNGTPVTNLDGSVDPNNLTMADVSADGLGGAISTSTQVLFLSADADQDGTPDNIDTDDDNDGVLDSLDMATDDEDNDGDGIGDAADNDDDNDGIPDDEDADADGDGLDDVLEDNAWRCTDLGCERTDFDNNPVRTFWTQQTLD
jgi:type IV pilus assembly protein PilY1